MFVGPDRRSVKKLRPKISRLRPGCLPRKSGDAVAPPAGLRAGAEISAKGRHILWTCAAEMGWWKISS
jgi:hypothetical protein